MDDNEFHENVRRMYPEIATSTWPRIEDDELNERLHAEIATWPRMRDDQFDARVRQLHAELSSQEPWEDDPSLSTDF